MKKSVIINLFSNIPENDNSVEKVESTLWAQRLDADIAFQNLDLFNYENIYLYHNENLNCFDKFDDGIVSRLVDLFDAVENEIKLFSLGKNIHEFGYIDQMEKIEGKPGTSRIVDLDFVVRFSEILSLAATLTPDKLSLKKAIIGDEFVDFFSQEDQAIYKFPGLKFSEMKNFSKFIKSNLSKRRYEEITISLCTNDIIEKGHKLNPEIFAKNYANEIINLQTKTKARIFVCVPLPIKFKYNKENDNSKILNIFTKTLEEYFLDFDIITFPSNFGEADIFRIKRNESIELTTLKSIGKW